MSPDRPVERVGTLIVGSGVAAAAVASRLLAADPSASILLLEAGPRVEMKNFRMWQDFLITGNKPYAACQDAPYPERDQPGANRNVGGTVVPLNGARLMMVGGSTVHWGGWSFRLKPEDFRVRANTGRGQDWPITYDDLERHYAAAESFIGVSGDSDDPTVPRTRPYPFPAFPFTLEDQPAIQALTELGIPYSHLPIARHGITDTTAAQAPCQTTGTCKYCPFGARFVAANALDDLKRWADHPHLELRDHAVVEELLLSDARTVRGVRYLDTRTRQSRIVEAERVVLAAGAIETPKLLLRSRSPEWPEGVGNAHDLVGRFLITHPYFVVQATLPQNPLGLQPEMDFPTLCSRHFDSEAEQALGKFILLQPPSAPSIDVAQLMQDGHTREEIDAAVRGPTTIQLHGMVEVFSEAKNRVTNLMSQRNALGLYETVVDYTQAPDFDERLRAITATFGRILEAMGGQDPVLQQPISWRADHAAATCRMATTAEEGVVDPDLRVFGTDNLYICSNAVFPSLGTVNPTLTLTALALRLGDHLGGAA